MSCLGCGVEPTTRHQKVFCSNRCQRAMERAENVARWLATGVGTPASGVAHYIRTYLLADQGAGCAICPNCDSQLPTFKARNRGKGRAWRRQRYADGKSY